MSKSDTATTLLLMLIGALSGILSAFVGGGAEIIIVPLLILFKISADYKEAVGVSLTSLLLPIGIVSVYYYSKETCSSGKSCVNWTHALLISFGFVTGSLVSQYASKLESSQTHIIFGALLAILGIFMVTFYYFYKIPTHSQTVLQRNLVVDKK